MTPTEKARRSDALHQGPDTRRVLCDMIANRESDLEDAMAENRKLRELVRDMWRDGMCECDERGACAECEYHFPDRMRELGVDE